MPDREWKPPEGHPITGVRAKELIRGDLGTVEREMLISSCAPLFWFERDDPGHRVLHSATITFARRSEPVIGVTAYQVLEAFEEDRASRPVQLRIGNKAIHELEAISGSRRLDLLTVRADSEWFDGQFEEITPVGLGKQDRPEEGRGIMPGGHPGIDRIAKPHAIDWGFFSVLGIARRVTDEQITWIVREPD